MTVDEPRLKAKLRVQAMLRQAASGGGFGAVLRRGDEDAGGILVVLRGPAGLTVLAETRDRQGAPAWLRGAGPGADEAEADGYVARQTGRDPDLWVVELEERAQDTHRFVVVA